MYFVLYFAGEGSSVRRKTNLVRMCVVVVVVAVVVVVVVAV